MEILGIGIPELILIFAIMLIVLGPRDMVSHGRRLGKLVRRVIQSPTWMSMMNTTREIRDLPTKFVREAGLDEDLNQLNRQARDVLDFKLDPGQAQPPAERPAAQFSAAPQAVSISPAAGPSADGSDPADGGAQPEGEAASEDAAASTDAPSRDGDARMPGPV